MLYSTVYSSCLSRYLEIYLILTNSQMDFQCLDVTQFNHSIDGYLDYLHLFAVIKYTAINAHVHIHFWRCVCTLVMVYTHPSKQSVENAPGCFGWQKIHLGLKSRNAVTNRICSLTSALYRALSLA